MNDDIRYEVIDGYIFYMSPFPSVKHQRISVKISTEFDNYLRKKDCDVIPEIDVSLEGADDTTKMKEWFRPDISIICDQDKIKENHIAGAPDLIVEILSKSTAKADKMIKFNRYQAAGVKEYWIVDPAHETVDIYLLQDGYFVHNGTYISEETIRVSIFDDFSIDLKNIFV